MGIRTELTLRLPNSPGALAGVCRLLAEERVNAIALSLDSGGHLHLLVDNPVRAAGVLRRHHHQVTEHDVLFLTVGNSPGGLAPMLTLIADVGVNVNYAYGAGGEGSSVAAVVLGVDDAQRASAAAGV
jgi:hypothetical protein